MNRNEYMAALRQALAGLPDEERASALRYYEEYFDDAGPENEQRVITDLGAPDKVAAQILADYRELTTVPRASQGEAGGTTGAYTYDAAQTPSGGKKGVPAWLIVLLVLLALPLGVPLLAAAVATIGSLLFAAAVVAVCLVVVVPVCMVIAGVALIAFSFFLWWTPASAIVTLGGGFASLALGILVAALMIKLCMLIVPPVIRGIVAILRWPIDKLRNRQNGGTVK